MNGFFTNPLIDQCFNIPTPPLTEKNLPDQTNKVVVITGGYAGVGQELGKILYQKNATIYIAGRNADKAQISMNATRNLFTNSKGRLEFLLLDLADLTTVKNAVETFMSKEDRLDVLVNNTGVMRPPSDSKTVQGYEQQLGTNALGHFLLAELLVPILEKTAASAPANTVRVTWAGSLGIHMHSPPNGVSFDSNGAPELFEFQDLNYGQSKAANLLMSVEFARRHACLLYTSPSPRD